ncbi:hypothetical protein QCN29_33270 [Streptomyces sp. HNM0663]|uniref:Fido domain-containing protein n=1 Tax=Streptomyces chengmaiensis TaxID=3040919 RepID=A0ABT6HXW3_9ACTN|nr:hypothetical protein [Streptomyces chengmaiensis]MDH2393553.1 hypothetical protein [Streptomyces chengmaiensis]
MRMFKVARWVGATEFELGAVAWGIFSFWRLHFDHTTQFAYHTLHETLDIAQNFGVPYSMRNQAAGLSRVRLDVLLTEARSLVEQLKKVPRSVAPVRFRDHDAMDVDGPDPLVIDYKRREIRQLARDLKEEIRKAEQLVGRGHLPLADIVGITELAKKGALLQQELHALERYRGPGGPVALPWVPQPGGSRDAWVDPREEGWALGHDITVMQERFGLAEPETPIANRKGKQAAETFQEFSRAYLYSSGFYAYQVGSAGTVILPDGVTLHGTWARFGDDFLHEDGYILRGDNGWIGRIANREELRAIPRTVETDYHLSTDTTHMLFVPANGGNTVRLALNETTITPTTAGPSRDSQDKGKGKATDPEAGTEPQPGPPPVGEWRDGAEARAAVLAAQEALAAAQAAHAAGVESSAHADGSAIAAASARLADALARVREVERQWYAARATSTDTGLRVADLHTPVASDVDEVSRADSDDTQEQQSAQAELAPTGPGAPEVLAPEGERADIETYGATPLSAFLPEDRWWMLYIDPRHHEEAAAAFQANPERYRDIGRYYDEDQSPGFQQSMVDAYRTALDDESALTQRMNSSEYKRLHELVTRHVQGKFKWSGQGWTGFPLRAGDLSADLLEEKLNGRILIARVTDSLLDGTTEPPITFLNTFQYRNPVIQTTYGSEEVPGLVDAIFNRHYEEIQAAASNDHLVLAAIARTVRALQVVHPFTDGNRRLNVQLLLFRLLLEQGLPPVVSTDLHRLFQGGYSVKEMASSLEDSLTTLWGAILSGPDTDASDAQDGPEDGYSAVALAAASDGSTSLAQPAPPVNDGSSGTEPGRATASDTSMTRIEAQLDTHRPPRLDRSLVPPSRTGGPVVFSDGSRLPAYLTGDGTDETRGVSYGHSQVTLRGIEQVVREIGDRMGFAGSPNPGPDNPLAHLERALRTTPRVFHGEGYESPPFRDAWGRVRVLRVTTRPHGNWERFTDAHDTKVDEAQRSQVTTGADKSVSTTFQVAPSLSVGPASGVVAYGRVGGALALNRGYAYGMQVQTLSQVETRMADGSHLHLDDVQYEVFLGGAPSGLAPSGLPRTFSPGETHLTFAVRNGLTVRLSDSETRPAEPGPAPRTMTLGPHSDYRLVHTEGYGPVRKIREWAVSQVGAEPGSAAYDEIAGFFSSENFHRMADRLAHGRVTGRQLFGEDGSRSPLGAFVVDRVVPGEATLLTETAAAEMRSTVQQTVKNERTLSKTYSQEVNAALGPSFDLLGFFGSAANLRAMLGAVGRYGRSTTHSSVFGGSGGRKIVGRAKKVPTDLYLVRKTVYVRRTGDKGATPFTTWSLDRMTRTEARRLAGWDDGTTLRRRNRNEPFAPVYLTVDNPAVLGMSRPEAFTYGNGDPVRPVGDDPALPLTLLDSFTDQVIRAAARAHPGSIAPLDEFGSPSDKRWRDAEHYRMALQNTLTVINTLSEHSVAGNLEALTTTGIGIGLVEPGRLTRAHRWIWIDGKLSDRRYQGTQNDLILRGSAPGTDRLDGQRSVVRTVEVGFDASLSVRDAATDGIGAPSNIGTVQAGPRWGRQKGHKTGYGATVSYEPLAASAGPSHLHSYRLELTARSGGYRRPRSMWRGMGSLGLLGTRFLVWRESEADLLAEPVVGRVLLSVPDEHTPDTDPHGASAATAPPRDEALDPAQTKALATGDTREVSASHATDPFGDQPYQTVSVGAHRELVSAVEAVMGDASGGSWHFAQIGAAPHDAAVRPFQPQYLTGGFDQASGPAGSRITGLFGKGPYLNRLGILVHRMRVVDPVVVSKPVKIETEQTVGSDRQASGAVTTAQTFTVAGVGALAHTHPVGPSLGGSYGLLGRLGRSRTASRTVTRTVTSEIDRDAEGHKVLVAGDTQHDIVGSVRTDGVLAPLHSIVTWHRTIWAGRRLTFASDWLGHLPEKAAHRLGLIRDRLGEVPRYTDRVWSQPKWLRDNPFGSYPVNSLDTTKVLADFDRQLIALGIDDASRDRVHSLVTPRTVRALRDQMSYGGTATRARVGGWGRNNVRVGGRTGSLRVELIADEPQFDGLDHSATLQDNRAATETVEEGEVTTRTGTTGVSVGEGVRTGDSTAKAAGPTYSELGTTSQPTSTSRSTARLKTHVFYANEPYAEFLTGYRLRLTLNVDGRTVARQEGDVGRLREQLPLSLTVPRTGSDPGDPLGTPVLDAPAPVVTVWQQGSVTPQSIDAWRSVPHPDGSHRPFPLPANGFHVRRVVGLDTLRAAGDLAVAKAYGTTVGPATGGQHNLAGKQLDAAVAKARRTGLTLPGTASALALHDGTESATLAAFFGDSTTTHGYAVAGLAEDTFAGGAQGDYRLYSKPDFSGARLLAVAPDTTMESAERHTDSRDASVSRTGVQDSSLGGQPLLITNTAGAAIPQASNTGVNTAETDGGRLASAEGAQVNVKPRTGRSFLFAIPTSWLGVADVDRHFKDSTVGSWLGRRLGPFGYVKPGPQAVEARTQVIAWVREDVARELGLVGDDTFPPRVADAWAKVTRASDAWVAADKKYWDHRRAVPELRDHRNARRRDLTAAKHRLTQAREADRTPQPDPGHRAAPDAAPPESAETALARQAVRDAAAALKAARRALHLEVGAMKAELRGAEGAAADFHRVRAETDRLTRWHRLSAEPQGPDEPEVRAGLLEPPPVVFNTPPANRAPERARYTEAPGESGGPTTLTSPTGDVYALRDVTADGDAFHHALVEGLHHAEPALLGDLGTLPDRGTIVSALRERLADRLRHPDNADLLGFASPDTMDAFSAAELAAAGIVLDRNTPEGREFDDSGRIPMHAGLSDAQRGALAAAQVLRPGDAADDAGWDHGAADLLPALAARTFGARITVVRGDDGHFQDFTPLGAAEDEELPHVVLHLKDRHYQLAVRDGDLVRQPALPGPRSRDGRAPEAGAGPRLPAHDTAPWNTAGANAWRHGTEAGKPTLTSPDGTVYDLVEPSGDGNGFWPALAAALPPGRDRDPVALVSSRPLPPSAVLDRTAPFTHDELVRAGVTPDAARAERSRRGGGTLPDDLALTQRQTRELIRTQLHTARRWDDATARTAAELAAAAHRIRITVVSEDGSAETHAPHDAEDGRTVTLYRRGAEYLLARPRTPQPTVTVPSNTFGHQAGDWTGLWSPARPIPEEDLANLRVPDRARDDIAEELSLSEESGPASPARRPAPAVPEAFLDAPRPREPE